MRSLFAPLAPWVDQFTWLLGVEIHIPAAIEQYRSLGSNTRYGQPRRSKLSTRVTRGTLHLVSCLRIKCSKCSLCDCVLLGDAYALPTGCNFE